MTKIFQPTVLVLSPNPSIPGGVSTFIESMKRHVKLSHITPFYVGKAGHESVWDTLQRLILVPIEVMLSVRKQKFSVVHLNPSFNTKSLIRDGLVLLALRTIGYHRILFYIHGWDFAIQKKILNNKILCRFAAWLLNGTDIIAVLSEEFRQGLLAMGVVPSRVIVTRTMFDGDSLNAVKNETPAPHRDFILFMSRFDAQKGGGELVQAFAALAADYPDLDLIMAGDGTETNALRQQVRQLDIAPRVKFTGYVDGVQKARLLRDCHLLALPTYYRSEGMPLVMLEAMGAGKPLLIGSAGAIRSVVSDPENGVVLDNITPQTVEAGLRRLLSDADFCAAAGRRNFERARAKFDAHIVTAEIEQLYKKVVGC